MRQRQNQSSCPELNSWSNNSSKSIDRVFGNPKETVREVKRGSATVVEAIGSDVAEMIIRSPFEKIDLRYKK
jgi:hypothetical protein